MRLAFLFALWLAACAVRPEATSFETYDFGLSAKPVAVADPLPGSLAIAEVEAPAWLAGEGIVYRLAYENPARPRLYSQSRWAASPEALLTQRVEQKLADIAREGVIRTEAGVRPDYLLRLELQEFSQVFDAPDASRATVRVRASLIDPSQNALIAQQDFRAERPAKPNAAGGVRGLRAASDAVLDQIANWIMGLQQTASGREGGMAGR